MVLIGVGFALILSGTALAAQDVIRIASGSKVTSLDPIATAAAGNIEAYGQLYTHLVRKDHDGNFQPGLAESWDISEDGLTYTFKLRAAKFSDGSDITADDVAFSLTRVAKDANSSYPAGFAPIKDVTAVDASTVKMTLEYPSAPMRFCRKLRRWSEKIFDFLPLGCQGSELGKRTESGHQLAFADHVRDFDPLECSGGRWEGLEPQHRSNSFLDRTVILFDHVVEVLDPNHLNWDRAAEGLQHRLMAVIPAVLAPLRSMTILRGRPFTSSARAKNLVAAGLLRRFDSMKSRVFPNLSTAR